MTNLSRENFLLLIQTGLLVQNEKSPMWWNECFDKMAFAINVVDWMLPSQFPPEMRKLPSILSARQLLNYLLVGTKYDWRTDAKVSLAKQGEFCG